jgi:hypothetical protein
MQMQTKVIERFGTSNDLAQFLHSPAGRQFVNGVTSVPKMFARERIVAAFSRAIMFTAFGVAFTIIAILQGDSDGYIPSSIVFSLGLGYLIAAGGWAIVLMWNWGAVETWLKGVTPAAFVAATASAQSLSLSFRGDSHAGHNDRHGRSAHDPRRRNLGVRRP